MFVSDLMSQLENLRPGFYKMFPLIVKSYGNELESQGTKIYGDEFLKDSLDLQRYKIGDSVQFKLIIKNEQALASKFKLLGKGTIRKPINCPNRTVCPSLTLKPAAKSTGITATEYNGHLIAAFQRWRFSAYEE